MILDSFRIQIRIRMPFFQFFFPGKNGTGSAILILVTFMTLIKNNEIIDNNDINDIPNVTCIFPAERPGWQVYQVHPQSYLKIKQ